MKFYNRKKEIDFFEKLKQSQGKKLIVLYGRRRIGKTALMKKVFESEDDFLYFFVEVIREETLMKELSESFSKAIYIRWYDLFTDLFASRKYVVLDEFQNFTQVNPQIFSALQHAWDDTESDCKLIVLGSYVGMMKKLFTDSKLPLFGRNDNIIKLGEFPINDSIEMLKSFGYNTEESFEIYFLIGGVPKYLLAFERYKPLKEKIYDLFIDDFAPFKEEAVNILIQEFGSKHKSYFSILKALSNKNLSINELADYTGIVSNSLSKFLSELEEEYEIVRKSSSILSAAKRNSRYIIDDELYRFYFNIVDRYFSEFEFDKSTTYEKKYDLFPNHYGGCFEEFCRDYILQNPKILPFVPEKIGKNWGRIPGIKNRSYDIDLIAYDENNIVFIECKWTGKKTGIEEYALLKERSRYVNHSCENVYYLFFSKNGFKTELEKYRDENTIFVGINDLF